MDDAISPGAGADNMSDNVELPCEVASLSINGVAPNVGDFVDLKVSGAVTRVVNKTAYVKPTTINDVPLPATPIQPNPMVPEMDRLRTLSQTADSQSNY